MTSYVSAELRRLVLARSNRLCEYCLVHEDDTYFGCQVDHVIAEKHGGLTATDNLCLACTPCNRAKGTDLGSLTQGGVLVRFFNPRTDAWHEHFGLNGASAIARTPIGEVTSRLFEFNVVDRLLERELLQKVGRYPSPQAKRRIEGELD